MPSVDWNDKKTRANLAAVRAAYRAEGLSPLKRQSALIDGGCCGMSALAIAAGADRSEKRALKLWARSRFGPAYCLGFIRGWDDVELPDHEGRHPRFRLGYEDGRAIAAVLFAEEPNPA